MDNDGFSGTKGNGCIAILLCPEAIGPFEGCLDLVVRSFNEAIVDKENLGEVPKA